MLPQTAQMCLLTSLTRPRAILQRRSLPTCVQQLANCTLVTYVEKDQSACLVSIGAFAAHSSFEAPDPQATLPISLFLSRRRRQPLHYNG